MSAVRGSKQYQMKVVPHRPVYKAFVFFAFLVLMSVFSWLTYHYGKSQGIALKVEVVQERNDIRLQLEDARETIQTMRSAMADLKLREEVDTIATQEVRQTIESLQSRIAQLNEEILFYKGVMAPNVGDKGLRIERINLEDTGLPDRFRYSLLLTQLVDKHEYVQGGVRISIGGIEGKKEKIIKLSDLDSTKKESIRFRFKYFQNIEGELSLPKDFQPREIIILAESTGRNKQRLEKKIDWQVSGG